jgi:large subunit ribosomal protein L22
MEAVASLRNCPTSTRKMRLVVDLIRGMEADKALNTLKFTQKEAAIRVEKLLLSAISNWKAKNEGERAEDSQLYVKRVFVDQGRTLRRFQPAPMGRAYRIRKRSNHVTLVVDSKLANIAAATNTEAAVEETPAPKAKAPKAPAKKTTTPKTTSKKTK